MKFRIYILVTLLSLVESFLSRSGTSSFELVSRFKNANQSSTHGPGVANRAVDGGTNGNYFAHSCSHTLHGRKNPWWYVDLGSSTTISKIVIYNRDDCCGDRLDGAVVSVGNDNVSPFRGNSQCGSTIRSSSLYSRRIELRCQSEGQYVSVYVPGTDALSLCELEAYTDIQAPEVLCPSDIEISSDVNQNVHPVRWQPPIVIDNTARVAICSKPSGSLFEVGFTKITCSATDPSGNEGNCSFVVNVKDVKEPTLTCPEHITVNNDVDQSENPVTWNKPTVIDNVHKDISATTCTHASGSIFDVGSTIVTCSATDRTGNVGSCSFVVHVIAQIFLSDIPTVMCPHSISACSDKSLQPVTWNNPTVVDAVDIDLVATCIPSSGDLFARGSTQVICSVTNSFGNKGNCSFLVDVTSPKAPQALTQDDNASDVTRGYLIAAVAVLSVMVLILVLTNIIIARYYKRKCDSLAGGIIMKMEDNNASFN
ncbi:sushi, von Willebrand factor type A, EGF and pentraxin domain-containing protein 1-like [Antedon mediterranea]|uniref:sushi, von Willebrand factor type A, EGF and pentraxin domain-containing protein 1-like n=1 Tax=Antedon mediterranea TaxID=105859 RepID=UPI003AF4F392